MIGIRSRIFLHERVPTHVRLSLSWDNSRRWATLSDVTIAAISISILSTSAFPTIFNVWSSTANKFKRLSRCFNTLVPFPLCISNNSSFSKWPSPNLALSATACRICDPTFTSDSLSPIASEIVKTVHRLQATSSTHGLASLLEKYVLGWVNFDRNCLSWPLMPWLSKYQCVGDDFVSFSNWFFWHV